MVNWPFVWWPQLQKAMAMAQAGEIGKLFSVKYRSAHAGPKELGCTPHFYNWLYDAHLNGAGALMDYGCYGSALARYLLGQPSRVTGVAGRLQKDYITLEDNAVIVMQYPRAIAITEASWTQIGHLTSYFATIYGSDGTLVVEPGSKGRLLLATPRPCRWWRAECSNLWRIAAPALGNANKLPAPDRGCVGRAASSYKTCRSARCRAW